MIISCQPFKPEWSNIIIVNSVHDVMVLYFVFMFSMLFCLLYGMRTCWRHLAFGNFCQHVQDRIQSYRCQYYMTSYNSIANFSCWCIQPERLAHPRHWFTSVHYWSLPYYVSNTIIGDSIFYFTINTNDFGYLGIVPHGNNIYVYVCICIYTYIKTLCRQ